MKNIPQDNYCDECPCLIYDNLDKWICKLFENLLEGDDKGIRKLEICKTKEPKIMFLT
jgi:hypothetical protein